MIIKTIKEGGYFGDIEIMMDSKSRLHNTYANLRSEVYCIKKDHFLDLIRNYKYINKEVSETASFKYYKTFMVQKKNIFDKYIDECNNDSEFNTKYVEESNSDSEINNDYDYDEQEFMNKETDAKVYVYFKQFLEPY